MQFYLGAVAVAVLLMLEIIGDIGFAYLIGCGNFYIYTSSYILEIKFQNWQNKLESNVSPAQFIVRRSVYVPLPKYNFVDQIRSTKKFI